MAERSGNAGGGPGVPLWRPLAASIAVATLVAAPAPAEGPGPSLRSRHQIDLPATRDVWISAMPQETDYNMGSASRIKLKIWQELGLLDFDLAAVKGRRIEAAHLFVKPAGGSRLGLNHGTDLNWLTLSTVSHPWVEGRSSTYGPDARGFGATFNESSYQKRDWGWPGAKVWNVILGNGNTSRMNAQLQAEENGWFRIALRSDLLAALISGASHGLALVDGSSETLSNATIKSRESGEGPYLRIALGDIDRSPPSPPPLLDLRASANHSTPTTGALEIGFRVPEEAFSYDLRVDGEPVGRWQIPFARAPGFWQSFPLVDLPPAAQVTVELEVLDAAGNRSATVAASGQTSAALEVPRLPSSPFQPQPADPPAFGKVRVWALPELTEVDPVSGKLLFPEDEPDPRRRNAVWDGARRTVRLAAARGEIVSFQIIIEGIASGCRLRTSSLQGPEKIDATAYRLWRTWYVGMQSEYALPLEDSFDVPPSDNSVEGQALQAITLDLPIPTGILAGSYRGAIDLTCDGGSVEISLEVLVYDVSIPVETHFVTELNCYRGPGTAGSPRFIDSFRLAHYHRATLNRVPYTHRGRVHEDWSPEVDARGRIIDWTRFDANLGGLLDGSWFQDNPRAGIPVPVLYLPFFEGWPLDFKQHYRPGRGVPTSVEDRLRRLRHDSLAPPIEQAIDPDYEQAFILAVSQFRDHVQRRGWHRTLLQFFLNNKPKYGYTLWTLDEPSKYLDWAALNYFGELFQRGIDDPEVYTERWQRELYSLGLTGLERPRPSMLFRVDVSRPMWQGSVSDGIANWIYVSTIGYRLPRLLSELRLRAPALMSQYGSPSAVTESNWEAAAWPLAAYLHGFHGILPWQSLGGPSALGEPKRNALLIDAGRHGHAVASYRLHGLRYGAQLSELLRLVELKTGWPRARVRLMVTEVVPLTLGEGIDRTQGQERGPRLARPTGARPFLQLKEGLLLLLEEASRQEAAGDRDSLP